MGNDVVGVTEESRFDTPFGTLLRFRKDSAVAQPRVLVVAPMSGHFATLLRGTVSVLLPDHDVYITDWKNARDIPLSDGTFGFDEYVDHLIRFLEVMGEGSHMIAVCQPAVAGSGRGGGHGRTRQPGAAAQPYADGWPDRYPIRTRPRSTNSRNPAPSSGSRRN